MSHMSQVQNPNGSDRFLLSQVSSQVVTGLPERFGPGEWDSQASLGRKY
jgi:hypothetical protein